MATFGAQTVDGVQVQGVSRDYVYFGTFNAERGRLISPAEIDANRPVTVLGWDVADQLFGLVDPIDKMVKIGNLHFRVVGVSEKKGSFLGNSQDTFAIIPLSVFRKMFGSRFFGMQLLVKPKNPELVKVAMDDATVAMRIQRRLRPNEPDNFGMFTSDTFLDIYHTATNGIFAVLIGVVALSLVVGGIVIMNIMLMVVSERTREIGLRKALGARRRDIVWQILTESVTLSTFGGCIGTGLGFIAAIIVSKLTPLPAAGAAVVGRDRHRHHRDRRPVLRSLSGDARGAAGSDRSVETGVVNRQSSLSRCIHDLEKTEKGERRNDFLFKNLVLLSPVLLLDLVGGCR